MTAVVGVDGGRTFPCQFGPVLHRLLTASHVQVNVCVFFFKQKTAYEIVSGDWSSDVCSSDREVGGRARVLTQDPDDPGAQVVREIGRASCGKECLTQCRSRWSPYH